MHSGLKDLLFGIPIAKTENEKCLMNRNVR